MLGPPASKSLWPFSPQSIPGLSLWLDAADNSSITYSSGTIVSVWKDKSGNGFNATPPIAGPSYSAASQNGLGTLAFDGASTFLLSNVTVNTASHSMFVVHNTASTNTAASGNDNSLLRFQNTVGYIVYPYSNGGRYGYFTSFTGGAAVAVSEGNVAGVYQIMNAVIQSGSLITYHNGSVVSSSSSGLTSVTSDSLSIGAYGIVPYQQQYYRGNIAEIIIFSVPLITSQRQQVEGYLAQKWGLQDSLPATHPYYAVTPVPGSVAISSPTAISGLKLWLDAADASTVTGTTSVTAWADKSGTGNNMSVTSGTISYASNTMTFASGGIMSSANSTAVVGHQSVVFVVCQPTTIPPPGIGYVFVCSNLNGGDFSIRFPTTTSVYATNAGDLGYSPGTYYINGTLGVPSGGTITFPSTPNIIYGLFSTSGTTAFALSTSFLSRYFIGKLYEVIVYTGPITTSQRASVELYLSNKWGITVTSTIAPTLATQLYKQPVFQRTFQPVDILGCSLWLDAMDPTSLSLSGTLVTQWNDKSGSNRHVTQATGGLQPTYSSTLNAIVFNATGYLNIPDALNSILPSYSIFVVEKRSSANVMFFIGQHDLGTANTALIIGYNATNISHHTTAYVADCQVTIPSYAGASEPVRINRYDYSGSTRDTVINGGQYSTYQSFSNTLTTWNNANIGAGFLSSTYSYIGNIHEIIFYNNVLTTSQAQQVESYLAWKWGLRSSLPSTHPGYILPSFSTAFTPKSLSNMVLWLDAADSSTITLSGSSVTQWIDKSGSGYIATPIDSAITKTTLNGTPALDFGVNRMTIPNFTWNMSFTSIMVWNAYYASQMIGLTASTDPSAGWYDYISTANWALIMLNYNATSSTDPNYVRVPPDPYPGYPAPVVTGNQWFIFSIGYTAGTTTITNYAVNGTARTANAVTAQTGTNTGAFFINGLSNGAYDYSKVGEIIHYNTSLNNSERQQVEGYLAWKWGLQNNLPSTHAYKKFRP